MGDLRQGALEGLVAAAVAEASGVSNESLRRALMLTGDLGATAQIAATSGEEGLLAVQLMVLRPIKPMLAKTAASVWEAIEDLGRAFVKWKLDGARIQVHRDQDEIRIFARNLNDVTARLPEIVEQVAAFEAASFVLDGEALTLGEESRPAKFQDSMSRFGRGEAGGTHLAGFYFDCLHLDGADLIDEMLSVRRGALERLVGAAAIPGLATSEPAAASAFLDAALSAGHESVMVKSLDSLYHAGRRGGAWRKVKPVITVDLVVLAADWGADDAKAGCQNCTLARGRQMGHS